MLGFIGDRIRKMVKVDKNTITRERGKYARLCVQVDPSKPLLDMFSIKGRHYKVEYEGIHILCISYGIFGHHEEVCSEKKEVAWMEKYVEEIIIVGGERQIHNSMKENLGPWAVVHKVRKSRRETSSSSLAKHSTVNAREQLMGSIFNAI